MECAWCRKNLEGFKESIYGYCRPCFSKVEERAREGGRGWRIGDGVELEGADKIRAGVVTDVVVHEGLVRVKWERGEEWVGAEYVGVRG